MSTTTTPEGVNQGPDSEGETSQTSNKTKPNLTDEARDGLFIRLGDRLQRGVDRLKDIKDRRPRLVRRLGYTATAAVIAVGGYVGLSQDNESNKPAEQPGVSRTIITEKTDVEGNTATQIDKQFIPAVPIGKASPVPEATNTPETSEIFDAGLIPESLQQKVIPIEQRLHRLALNNNSDTLSELDPEDTNTLKWRGGITFEARDTSGNMMYGLMRNPAVVHETTKYYATAHHEESGELITIEIAHDEGDEIVLTGNEEFNVAFWKLEGAPYSGQLVSAKPMSINENGLETFDNHASLLRGDGNTEDNFRRMATVDLYSNINEASIDQGLEKRIITGKDDEIINRDQDIYESINKENPTGLKLD